MLLVATSPTRGPARHEDEAEATLPAGMRALGLVAWPTSCARRRGAALASFTEAGVSVKVISGDDPETVAALARQAGLGDDLRLISGHELDDLDDEAFAKAAEATTVFGRITPAAEGAAGRRAARRAATTWR